jgi:hypothetical protein
VVRLTTHLEQVLEEPEVADGSELDLELFPELSADGFLTALPEVDPATERTEVGLSVVRVDHPRQEEPVSFQYEREGTRTDDAGDPHIGESTAKPSGRRTKEAVGREPRAWDRC